jgi:hypothetical protein
MVPVRPAARSDRLISFIASLDPHVWDPPLGLPVSEMRVNEVVNRALALQIVWRHRAEFVVITTRVLSSRHATIGAVLAFVAVVPNCMKLYAEILRGSWGVKRKLF